MAEEMITGYTRLVGTIYTKQLGKRKFNSNVEVIIT
jgi:hypothetical protein